MSFTYVLSTEIGKLRLKVQDTKDTNILFQDEELQVLLDAQGGSLNLAAADALDILATRAAQLQKSETIGDYSYDGKTMAAAFREAADRYRKLEAGVLDAEPWFETAEMSVSGFSVEEIVAGSVMRGEGE